RIDPEHSDIQIVHVHGSYWFYDCCNLRGEIEARAQAPAAQPMTMLSLLEDLLGRRSPLVIGYSGWEGDVIMTALQRRLSRPLPYNVYWFCFKRSDIAALPPWLVQHRQVHMVSPPEELRITTDDSRPSAQQAKQGTDVADGSEIHRLSAERVVERLIQELNLQAPELARNPLSFFA